MTYGIRASVTVAVAIALIQTTAVAQGGARPTLHVSPRWKECSFRLDPSLTQSAWRQFTREAGLVTYFRPLSDARPMGRRAFEVSLLQWQTGIDDEDAAWNDTFVHPDSSHWLFEGSGLQFPGLMLRAGVTDRTDVGVYATKAVGANYGFYGLQLQRNLVGATTGRWASAARASFVSMYGPDDLAFTVYGVDLLASRQLSLARWATVSPYAGVSGYLATSHEKSRVVSLDDERVPGLRGSVGAELRLSHARLAAQYDVASVRSLSFKVGVGR
jgi:hypothetical protein